MKYIIAFSLISFYFSYVINNIRTFVLRNGFASPYYKKYLIKLSFSSDITNFLIELR